MYKKSYKGEDIDISVESIDIQKKSEVVTDLKSKDIYKKSLRSSYNTNA